MRTLLVFIVSFISMISFLYSTQAQEDGKMLEISKMPLEEQQNAIVNLVACELKNPKSPLMNYLNETARSENIFENYELENFIIVCAFNLAINYLQTLSKHLTSPKVYLEIENKIKFEHFGLEDLVKMRKNKELNKNLNSFYVARLLHQYIDLIFYRNFFAKRNFSEVVLGKDAILDIVEFMNENPQPSNEEVDQFIKRTNPFDDEEIREYIEITNFINKTKNMMIDKILELAKQIL